VLDPATAFVFAVLMMLLNGGVLGLMHKALPPALQPSARSWRIATLLMAAGSVLLIVQGAYPPGFILPLANAALMLGLTLYWRALRQFYDLPDRWFMLLPTIVAVGAIAWFATVSPDLVVRVVVASVCWLVVLIGGLHALWRGRVEAAISRRVMVGVFVVVALFTAARLIWFASGSASGGSVVDARSLINIITPLVATVLPVIGTTAFLLMCSERIRRQWEHAASTDLLTGLANRLTLAREGERRLAPDRSPRRLAVAVIDIDHFKRINDRHGHETGDLALRHVAQQLRDACRPTDLAARHGGEEFVVLLDAASGDDIVALGERLRAAVEVRPLSLPDDALRMTVSIGVTAAHEADRGLDELLRRADRALYAAKRDGRNRVVLA
jgi:diguanylate cyclase (GGDEF)-like protein